MKKQAAGSRQQAEKRHARPARLFAARRPLPAACSRGYTLVEFFVTIAVLVIVLGLMVDLANRVRRNSADRLTRQLLQRLAALMQDYADRNDGQLPPVTTLVAPNSAVPDEATLQLTARRNNADVVRILRGQFDLSHASTTNPTARDVLRARPQDVFAGLPLSLYDEVTLRDPWGNPIVFMPGQHPLLGMAPGDHFFFFSPGPDRKYLTRDDNLYSYEETGGADTASTNAR